MLREFDLQRMHWADKTQSMLHQRQMEACETRLLSYPTESIFTLQDERETECWWQCSYDAEESPKSPVLHTLREMRANVLARLPVEAALLTETEHALIVRLILCGGQARIDGWQELSAAESLLRRLWCTLEVDEQDVLLHLPRELMTPLSLTLREQRHQELRSRLLFFDTDTKAALYLSGMLSAKQALSRLYESVLHDSYANDEALALRYLKAGNDFYYNRAGELFLLHPGLADPEKILREGGFPMGYQPDLPSERALMASRDLLPEEFETDAQLSALLDKPSIDDFLNTMARPQLANRDLLVPARFREALDNALQHLRDAAAQRPAGDGGDDDLRILNRATRLLGEEVSLRDLVQMYRSTLYQG